jgi:hypothetical protein
MKHHLATCILSLSLTLSQQAFTQAQPVKQPAKFNMEGSYTMFRQTINAGNGDSVTAVHQLKLFTDKYVMYARRRTQDSLADFGIGTYRVENGKVIESIFYSSNGPQNAIYELAISRDNDGYIQVINFPGDAQNKSFILTEDYKRFGRKIKSPLDGAWQQVKKISVSPDGSAVTDTTLVQFKVFEAGSFIWANAVKDNATNQYQARYGYGSFDMRSPKQAAETNLSSTYAAALIGKPVLLDLKFPSKDMYEQTITYPDGSKLIEVYKRLK